MLVARTVIGWRSRLAEKEQLQQQNRNAINGALGGRKKKEPKAIVSITKSQVKWARRYEKSLVMRVKEFTAFLSMCVASGSPLYRKSYQTALRSLRKFSLGHEVVLDVHARGSIPGRPDLGSFLLMSFAGELHRFFLAQSTFERCPPVRYTAPK